MQEIPAADWPDFPIAEKAGQAQWSKPLLDHLRVVVGAAEQVLAAAIAAKKAPTVDRRGPEGLTLPREQFVHVFRGGLGRAPLELQRLPSSRQSADEDAAGAGVGTD